MPEQPLTTPTGKGEDGVENRLKTHMQVYQDDVYVWDVETQAWLKKTGGSGGGNTVEIYFEEFIPDEVGQVDFPLSEVVGGPDAAAAVRVTRNGVDCAYTFTGVGNVLTLIDGCDIDDTIQIRKIKIS